MPDETIAQNIYNTLFKLIPNYMSVAETEVIQGTGTTPPNPVKDAAAAADNKLTVGEPLLRGIAEAAEGAAKKPDNREIKLNKKLTSGNIDKINECLNIEGVTVESVDISSLFDPPESGGDDDDDDDGNEFGFGGGKPKRGGGKTHKNIPVGLINSKKNKPKNSLKKNNQKSNIKTKKN